MGSATWQLRVPFLAPKTFRDFSGLAQAVRRYALCLVR